MNIELQKKHYDLLCIIKDIFDKNNIRYWLDTGTLICCYRDGDLEYEHDIDIGCYIEDFNKVNTTRSDFESLGIVCKPFIPFYHTIRHPEDEPYVHCDVLYYYPIHINGQNWRTCHGVNIPFSVPEELISDFTEYPFDKFNKNINFPIPKNTEEYLEWYFGDWKTRLTTDEYTDYQLRVKRNEEQPVKVNTPRNEVARFWLDASEAHYGIYEKYRGKNE